MWILLISIATALVLALVISSFSSRKTKEPEEIKAPPADCCGAHEVCDKETLIAHTHGDAIYFNDEELDDFKGKSPDQYSAQETELFRDVLFTMKAHEVSDWLRSLMVRGIKLPLDVREEALAIIRKQRA